MERRKANVSNLGSTWLKPLGVSKTLFQMREEERERQEHEEAMRREEMLAGELAEAEAAAAAAAGGGNIGAVVGVGDGNGTTVLEEVAGVEGREVGNTNRISGGADDGDMELMGGDDDMDEMGGRDLDEDIPDADEGGFGYDGASDDDDEDEQEEEENDQAEEEEEEEATERNTTTGDHGNDDENTVEAPQATSTATGTGSSILHPRGRNDNSNIHQHQQQQQQRELANVRANEERMREMMARGGLRPTHVNLADGAADEDDDIDEEDQAHMLEEDDIIGTHNSGEYSDDDGGMTDDSLGMNANLDDDIPEADEERAQSGFYEHTDSEAELLDSSDNEGGQEQVGTGAGIGISSSGNGGNMSGSHRRAHRVSYGPGSTAGSARGQHRRVSLPRQQQQQRLLRTSLAGNARRSTIGAPRSSLDISGLLSVDESSPMMRSSPRVRRLH